MSSSENPIPLVSVCCVTYNHENFISQCLNGFLMQKTNFAFEVLVHEDASTDSTAAVVREYEEKYPYLFRGVYQSENQFKKQNTLVNILFPMARGKYIALCEGDDYWTDPLKLQKQVDLMLNDDSIALSFHNATEIKSDHEKKMISGYKTGFINPSTVINKKIRMPTLSMLFKKSINLNYELLLKLRSGDRYLEVAAVSAGKIFYFDEVMGVKRTLHTGSLGQWKKDPLKAILEKYNSNVLLLGIIPAHLKKYMHRYLFSICIQILKLRRLSELKFVVLASRHLILGI